jgi:RND family efflux transporter MFP subunit
VGQVLAFPQENSVKALVRSGWLPLFGLSCLAAVGCGNTQPQNGPPKSLPEVKVSLPVTREVVDYVDFPGRAEAIQSIDLRARVTGYLDKVHFKEGADVKEGDVLVEIDARSYKAELARAEANLIQSEARRKRLEADYKRAEHLFARDAMGREEFDKVAGDRAEAIAAVGVAKASRDLAELNVSYCKICAPISGRISRRYIDPGNLVKADDTVLTTLVSRGPIYAYFDLDERTAMHLQKMIREGKIKWSLDAELPVLLALAEEGYHHKGEINFADNRVDPDTGTWRLRGLFANKDHVLTPGLFVRIRLPLGEPFKALLVSEQALGTDQGQKFVYVVDPSGKVEYRRVKVGRLHDGLRAITDGLAPGEKVVVHGLQRVRPGIQVNPVVVEMPVVAEPAATPKSETRNPKSETKHKTN